MISTGALIKTAIFIYKYWMICLEIASHRNR